MPLYGFDTVFGMGAQVAGMTVDTDAGITSVLPVAVPVGGVVEQYRLPQTEHTVMVFIVHILLSFEAALHGLRLLVGSRQHTSVFQYLFADVWGLAGRRGNDCLQNKAMLVAGGVGLISLLTLYYFKAPHYQVRSPKITSSADSLRGHLPYAPGQSFSSVLLPVLFGLLGYVWR